MMASVLLGLCIAGAAPTQEQFQASSAPHLSGHVPGITAQACQPLSAELMVNPGSVSEGQTVSVTTTPSGGHPSPGYTYNYYGFPSGCGGNTAQSFSCNPAQTGNFNVYVNGTDNNGNLTKSNSVSLTVTPSSNGNNNGGGSNNSSNPFGSLRSGLGSVLSLLIIFGVVGFVTWILLIVGVWIIAIALLRRLPKRGAASGAMLEPATMECANCSAANPVGSKFCSECGTSTTPKAV